MPGKGKYTWLGREIFLILVAPIFWALLTNFGRVWRYIDDTFYHREAMQWRRDRKEANDLYDELTKNYKFFDYRVKESHGGDKKGCLSKIESEWRRRKSRKQKSAEVAKAAAMKINADEKNTENSRLDPEKKKTREDFSTGIEMTKNALFDVDRTTLERKDEEPINVTVDDTTNDDGPEEVVLETFDIEHLEMDIDDGDFTRSKSVKESTEDIEARRKTQVLGDGMRGSRKNIQPKDIVAKHKLWERIWNGDPAVLEEMCKATATVGGDEDAEEFVRDLKYEPSFLDDDY